MTGGGTGRSDEPRRVVSSFSGDAADMWKMVRRQYPDASDSERLELVLERLQDPEDLALLEWKSFAGKARSVWDGNIGDALGRLESILIAVRNGNLDTEIVRDCIADAHAEMIARRDEAEDDMARAETVDVLEADPALRNGEPEVDA